MAARLGIFLYGIFTVVAVIVAGLTAAIAVEYPSPDTTMLIALGFACARSDMGFRTGCAFCSKRAQIIPALSGSATPSHVFPPNYTASARSSTFLTLVAYQESTGSFHKSGVPYPKLNNVVPNSLTERLVNSRH
jgi:hypothetical protein